MFLGMDTEQGLETGAAIGECADFFADLAVQFAFMQERIEDFWRGEDADEFDEELERERRRIEEIAEKLRKKQEELERQRREQEDASAM